MTDLPPESFGTVLREKLAELDADEQSTGVIATLDPIERLSLDARQVVNDDDLGPMPRPGHQAYITIPAFAPPDLGHRHLNLLR